MKPSADYQEHAENLVTSYLGLGSPEKIFHTLQGSKMCLNRKKVIDIFSSYFLQEYNGLLNLYNLLHCASKEY